MICFQDKTFCVSPDCTCENPLTKKVIEDAERWWGKGAPIAVGFLCGAPEGLSLKQVMEERFKELREQEP